MRTKAVQIWGANQLNQERATEDTPMAAKVKVTGALKHRCRRQLEEKLKKGYQAMAKADRATARRNLRAGWEAMK